MPIGRGLMQAERIKFYHTNTAFGTITPATGTAQCGQTCTFHVTVTNVNGGPVPAGAVQLVDLATSTVVATSTVTAGAGTLTFAPSASNLFLQAQFLGGENRTGPVVNYEFGPSNTTSIIYNVVSATTTTTITTPPADTSFCSTANEEVIATITSAGLVTGGTVDFRLYTNDTNFIVLPSAPVVSGTAAITIPSGTTTAGNTYYIQALYNGNSCFNSSQSLPGTNGLRVFSTNSLGTTTTIVPTDSSYSFCYYDSKQFTITVNGPDGYFPTSGTVELWSSNGDFSYEVATGTLSGTNSTIVTAPGSTMSSFAFAVYDGDGSCYGASESNFISINPFTYGMTISNYSVPTYGCSGTGQDFYFQVHLSTPGPASGTFYIESGSFGQLASQVVSASNGTVIHFSNVFVPAGYQYLYVRFVHNTVVNCFGDYNSPSFNYNSQGLVSPTIVGSTSPSNYNFEPVTIYATGHHNGGFTTMSSSYYIEYYDPSSAYHADGPFPFVDFGDPTTNSHTYSSAPGGFIGTYTFYIYYVGNNCYAGEFSSSFTYNSQEFIH